MAASPPPSEMENEIEFRFHFEKSSRIKKLFALRAAQFFFDMGNSSTAITKHRLGLSLKRLRRWSRQTKLCQGRCPVQAEPAGIRSSLRREERHSSFQIFIIIHS